MGFETSDLTGAAASTYENQAWVKVAANSWAGSNSGNHREINTSNSAPTTGVDASLPGITLCDGRQAGKPLYERLEDQKDNGLGTPEHPVNENCQTTAIKNVFHFLDRDCDAANVVPEMEKMLHAIDNNYKKGKDESGINLDAVANAFRNNHVDHLTPEQIKESIKEGNMGPFIGFPAGHGNQAYANPEAMTTYLAEKGCDPQAVKLDGSNSAAQQVMDALDGKDGSAGKPVILSDKNTYSLYQLEAHAKGIPWDQMGGKVVGHTYMMYKDKNDGNYYVMDNTGKPNLVDRDVLQKKLHDTNCGAIIVNSPPDGNFLKHGSAAQG